MQAYFRVQSGHVIFGRRNFPFRGQNAEMRTITEPLLQAKKFIKARNQSDVAVAISSRFESVSLLPLPYTAHEFGRVDDTADWT